MSSAGCEKEPEVMEAVRAGVWPEGSNPLLRAHVAGCPICAEVALVAGTLREENAFAHAEARLPQADLVWWKAQLAARRAAAKRAAAPIALAEKLAYACAALSLVGVSAWQWRWAKETFTRLGDLWPLFGFSVPMGHLFLASTAAAMLLMGFGLYLMWSEK